MTAVRDRPPAVAVTGTGAVCALAPDADGLVAALRAGHSGVTTVPVPDGADDGTGDSGPQRTPRLAAPLRDFALGDAVEACKELPEAVRHKAVRTAARSPRGVQVSLAAALQAWQEAGLAEVPVPAEESGVLVGGQNLGGAHADALRPRYDRDPGHLSGRYALHAMDTDHVGTVSSVLGLRGEGCTVGGASAAGNVALVHAARLVASGVLRTCLVIGALTDLSAMERQGLFNAGAMAGSRGCDRPGTRCRPFDADREGFVPGQGAGCVVLESAASAYARGAPVRGWIAGHALGLDGNHLSDPDPEGEARVIRRALQTAGVPPGELSYINTHGTASPRGDETEARALRLALGDAAGQPWVNATKGWTGHCLGGSGVLEAVAVLGQIRDGFVHPNANLATPLDTGLRFAGPAAEPAGIGYALSNAFGFGGINSSVLFAAPGRTSP